MWMRKPKPSPTTSSSVTLFPNIHHVVAAAAVVSVFGQLLCLCRAQSSNNASTDPSEVQMINSVFQKWGISAKAGQWNISGEPCSGAAIDSVPFDDTNHNPFIKCDCSYSSSTICHITQMKVIDLSIRATIPDELWNLTYLFNLDLRHNLLTGSLSPGIGNLTRLQFFSVGINGLSGEVPAEIGQLTELLSLSFAANEFSGSLPSEIGNLQKMEQFYFHSSRFSGEIPTTFANLQRLKKLWGSNNELTGKIPDFIGSWPNLTQLVLHGNSFEGPIPLAISNITSLTDLRISSVTNGSSSLDFIKGLTNLTILILRNNNISDSIPSDFGEYKSLAHLDLSFNNLVGPIPDTLLNLTNLNFLFLGNNSLNGTLPAQISPSLTTLDVSYNDLRGSLPTWINGQNMQFNPVGNNFTIDNNNTSSLPAGLNCLQQNFPCNSGTGRYYSFSIKCGGPQITSSNGIVFEKENETLGPATYYVTASQRWAVSNVGYFTDTSNPTYTLSSASQFTSTLDTELFRTARISASSLRYYGLGLENGNYTVTLQFAEITIQNSEWKSLGRRIFDIYIQGTSVEKDFDIRREAGGSSFVAVKREFTAQVSKNYLEIHLFWAGKGTCCIPAQGTYGPLISAISATPDFKPSVSNNPPALSSKKNQTGMIVGIVVGVGVGVAGLFALLFMFSIVRQRRKAQAERDEELLGIDVKPYTFSYGELRAATEDFNPINKLGEGGFGPVFKGMLNDGRAIAVKQLSLTSNQGKNQFVTEIATISAVQHRNLVKLYGCCIDGDKRLLVYEYLENKSLDKALFGERGLFLEWGTRYEICLGIARGLSYLHEESRLRIVHRDVKASNILLDSDLVPKISDFGLAKLYDDKKTHISTRVAGTIGYLAPEYAMRGHLTEKADVFAFGVVALEIISGRPNSDTSLEEDKVYLLELAWQLHETNQEVDLVDPRLSAFNEEEVKRVVGVALLCTQTSPTQRPSMSRVVAMLCGDIEVNRVATKPGYLTDWNFHEQTSFMSSEISTNKESEKSYYSSTPRPRTPGGADLSPVHANKSMLHREIISEGR